MADQPQHRPDDPVLTPSPRLRIAGALVILTMYAVVLGQQAPPASGDTRVDDVRRILASSEESFAAGRMDEALTSTELLVERMPTQALYVARLAQIYTRLNRHRDAGDAWLRVMEMSPTPEDACPMVVHEYTKAGDAAAASAAIERCVAASPDDPDFLLMQAQAHLSAGRLVEARRSLDSALALTPAYADLHLVLGIIEFSEGHRLQARQRFERFLELSPDRRPEVSAWLTRTGSGK